jgi:hypothetical protein
MRPDACWTRLVAGSVRLARVSDRLAATIERPDAVIADDPIRS